MSKKPNVKELRNVIERIKNINIKIYSKTLEEKEDYFFKNHYEDIMKHYPFLVSQICSGKDLDKLEYMLNSLEQVENGNSSKDEMDKVVGERLADEYIKPLDKPIDSSKDSSKDENNN
tara:strand:+ start:6048 stop:6401 length:354 start_codon:yes stop_codon:yes gene_type:complete